MNHIVNVVDPGDGPPVPDNLVLRISTLKEELTSFRESDDLHKHNIYNADDLSREILSILLALERVPDNT